MLTVKDILVKPISASHANAITAQLHYSGKYVRNSQLHLGAFVGDKCHGVMQFGPSIMKKNMLGLVAGTEWNQFIELNRMAFSDVLPKNSESRCLMVALRIIKKKYPHLKWMVTYADATQCGDGTIYRACGFTLTRIKPNVGTKRNIKTGEVMQDMQAYHTKRRVTGEWLTDWKAIDGHMMRYIYFFDQAWRKRLAVEELPYSAIKELGAGMYKGKRHV